MIKITAFNNKDVYLNPDLFEKMEATPDTVITLTNGKVYVVKDSPDIIVKKIIEYRKQYTMGIVPVEVKE